MCYQYREGLGKGGELPCEYNLYSEGLLGETVTVVNTQGVYPYSERLLGENGTFSQVFYP